MGEWEKRMSGNVIYNKSARSASVNPAIIVTDTGQKTNDQPVRLDTWELAFSNGGAIMDEIPVWSRDTHEQLAFRDQRNATNNADNDVYNNGSLNTRKRGLDVNRYATKKTIAQGMLDVALLTANASQLKYVLQLGEDKHDFYYLMLALIILSIILQVIHAVILFILGPMNVESPKSEKTLMILNHVALSLSLSTMF